MLRDSGGRSREWRAPLVQVWGFTRFPDLAWVWSTCGYCSLCDYHSEPGTTVPQRTQLEFFREIPLPQWKKKDKDSAASVVILNSEGHKEGECLCHMKGTCYCLDICDGIFWNCCICDYSSWEIVKKTKCLIYFHLSAVGESRSQLMLASIC